MNEYFDITSSEVSALIEYAALSYSKNLTNAKGGNVSIRYGEGMIISGTNTCLRSLGENSLVYVSMDAKTLFSVDGIKPSKEFMMHLAIYKARPDVNSVFHLHPPASTAVSAMPGEFPVTTESAREKLPVLPKVPYAPAGSMELANSLEAIVKTESISLCGALLENHGIIAFGSTPETAFNTAELIEASATNLIYKKILGIL